MAVDAFILFVLWVAGARASVLFLIGMFSLLLWPFWTVLAASIGDRKWIERRGALLGLAFGALGVLLVLAAQGDRRECPFCRSLISSKASLCAYCTEPIPDRAADETAGI